MGYHAKDEDHGTWEVLIQGKRHILCERLMRDLVRDPWDEKIYSRGLRHFWVLFNEESKLCRAVRRFSSWREARKALPPLTRIPSQDMRSSNSSRA